MTAMCYRCSTCDKNWPFFGKYAKCPLCQDNASPMQIESGKILTDAQAVGILKAAEHAAREQEQPPEFQSIHPRAVWEHRYGGFMRMGFGPWESELLAHTRHDLHATKKMVSDGCSLELALEILL